MPTGYTAYELTEESRAALLKAFPPKYADVIAHHITQKYGAAEGETPAQPKSVIVAGYHDSGAIQVLVALVDGRQYQAEGLDGAKKFLHITLSLDREQGVSPKNSNDVLQKIFNERGQGALYNLQQPLEIKVVPKFLLDEEKPAAASALKP